MKKLIPFTLERWKQGNCTPKTADGREVKDLVYQPSQIAIADYVFCGILEGYRQTWQSNGVFCKTKTGINFNLMLEVDCEVVYVSLFRYEDGTISSMLHLISGSWEKSHSFIKEIKVEL
jgi:hypothetical protein